MGKRNWLLAFVAIVLPLCTLAQVKTIKPSGTFALPSQSLMDNKAKFDYLVENNFVFEDLYSGKCSWYCGGVIDTVEASSCLPPQGKFDYLPGNAHDFDHTSAWVEGANGQGVGEYLVYRFPGGCPRITTVKILNGYVKNQKSWCENSRVKRLKMYYNDEPYAILLLADTRNLQCFDVGVLGPHDPDAPQWSLKFEILEVYPGTKFKDTAISELYFDGIDVH